jgi:spore maturation protein A
MLNYIWAGLIILSFVFAGASDFRDLANDTYRNGEALPVELSFPEGYDPAARRIPVEIDVDPASFASFYGTEAGAAQSYAGYLLQSEEGVQLRFDAGASFPEPLATIHGVSQSRDTELQGTLVDFSPPAPVGPTAAPAAPLPGPSPSGAPTTPNTPGGTPAAPVDSLAAAPPAQVPADPVARSAVRFAPVRFVKINAITAAAIEFAQTAAELALGLVGALALFLGLLKIAENAGIIYAMVKIVRPVLRPLFPEVPPDHPALGMIALNLAANVFGLGNAATPFGIKAMEELQKLNPSSDTATNPMVMLLAINTASVQIVPPVLLIALMGLQVNELIFPILITTGLGLVVAIVSAKLYARLPGWRRSDPNLNPPPRATAGARGE